VGLAFFKKIPGFSEPWLQARCPYCHLATEGVNAMLEHFSDALTLLVGTETAPGL